MMKLTEILPTIIDNAISFYIEFNRIIYNREIIIKHPDLLYNDMYCRIYNEYMNIFETDDVYEVFILNDINPFYTTYNKLSCDNNILETLVTYINEWIIQYRIHFSYSNTIIGLSNDIPFDNSLCLSYRWIKSIIDIYR